MAQLKSLSPLIDKEREITGVSINKCEIFLSIYQNNFDLEFGPDDAIEMVSTSQTIDEMIDYIVECNLCFDKITKNKVLITRNMFFL